MKTEIETVKKHCIHKDCKYRGYLSYADEACFYMYYTGSRRGCPISQCTRYAKGTIQKIITLEGMIYRDDI